MKRIVTIAAAASIGLALNQTVQAQTAPPQNAPPQNATFYQTCAMQARLAEALIAKDPRAANTAQSATVSASMATYANSLEAREAEALASGYAQAEAFGWSKDRVDEQHAAIGAAAKANHIDPALAAGRITANLVMAVNTCAHGDEAAWGQSKDALVSALEQLLAWARA